MTFGDAVRSVYGKYATFEGRATRPEFWWFLLFYVLVVLCAYVVMIGALIVTRSFVVYGVLGAVLGVFGLLTIIPYLAVVVRRLHDTDRSGWWFWISLIPVVGFIILLALLAAEGTRGYNQFGPPAGAPPADGYAEYTGWTRAEALARFSEDAQRAAASGFQPVTQNWDQRGNVEVLRVWYARGAPAGWPAPPGAPPAGGLG